MVGIFCFCADLRGIVVHAAEAPPDSAPVVDADADGDRLFAQGKLHYELGEYSEAIVYFRRAYEKTRDPGFLFNVAQAHRLLGKCRQALQVYSHFLRLAPEHPNAVAAASNVSILEAQCPNGPTTASAATAETAIGGRQNESNSVVRALANAKPPQEPQAAPRSEPSGHWPRWRRVAVASTLTLGIGAAVGSVLLRYKAAGYERQADGLAVQLEGMGLVLIDGAPAASNTDLQRQRQRTLMLENRAEWSAVALSASAGALLSAALILWAPWESWSVKAGPRHVDVAFKF
ncbi:MAG: hypothetical protein SF187_11665 [Deltaproteobacteria bacterium]|nr:hypothetical protein [Deltaproteobacteria bacterium]